MDYQQCFVHVLTFMLVVGVTNNGSFPELCIFFAFICITFHLHYICITFAFRIAPRIYIFALHLINISKCQINVK